MGIYGSIVGCLFLSVVTGAMVMFVTIYYLDHRLSSSPEDANDRRVEFSFCLGGLTTCAIFLQYATWQLWSELGNPFSIAHSVLSILWVTMPPAIWWLYHEMRNHAWWVKRYMDYSPKQTVLRS